VSWNVDPTRNVARGLWRVMLSHSSYQVTISSVEVSKVHSFSGGVSISTSPVMTFAAMFTSNFTLSTTPLRRMPSVTFR
jgi:hypothetical protein